MSKKPAFNGIDYTPRREKAVRAAHARPLERHIHGVVQHQARFPVFEVKAGGKTVEITDSRAVGHTSFGKAQTLPKVLSLIRGDGSRVLLDYVTQTGRRMPQEELAA